MIEGHLIRNLILVDYVAKVLILNKALSLRAYVLRKKIIIRAHPFLTLGAIEGQAVIFILIKHSFFMKENSDF